MESEKVAPQEYNSSSANATETSPQLAVVEFVLRIFLFAATLASVLVMVTSKQTELIPTPFPTIRIPYSSKFTDSPAFIYFVAALSAACLYSIITIAILAVLKRGFYKKLAFHFFAFDVLALGIVAAATGAAGGVAYIGLRGNSHSRWNKICNLYDTFCQHLGGAIACSLVASILLVFLILLSFYNLSRKIRN